MKATLFLLAVLLGFVLCQEEIKTGRYSLVTLNTDLPKYFKLSVPGTRVADITIQVNPLRCNGAIRIYADFKNEKPTSRNANFQSVNEQIGKISVLEIPEEQVEASTKYLYIGLETTYEFGSDCAVYLNALLGHYQNQIVLEEGVSTYGNFSDTDDFHHFYEFRVNVTEKPVPKGYLGVLVTGLDYQHIEDDSLQVYVSTKTSRPLPTSHQWQGLMVEDAAFVAIVHEDPEFVADARYWIGVNTASAHRPVPYTVSFFHQGIADSRTFLTARTAQIGFSLTGEYTYFQAFLDAGANSGFVRLLNKVGSATMYISTKTKTPTKDNYEFKGTFAEFKNPTETPVYIGVYGEAGSPGVAVYDLFFHRD